MRGVVNSFCCRLSSMAVPRVDGCDSLRPSCGCIRLSSLGLGLSLASGKALASGLKIRLTERLGALGIGKGDVSRDGCISLSLKVIRSDCLSISESCTVSRFPFRICEFAECFTFHIFAFQSCSRL